MSHEFRLSTPDDWRLRGIVGAFYEDNKLFDQTDWTYKTIPSCTSNTAPGTPGNSGCLSNVGTAPGTTVENPGVQNDNVAFFEDTQRDVKQTAFFASVDFDLIPKVLTLTAGTRHYQIRQLPQGQRHQQFRLLRAGCAGGRLRCGRQQPRQAASHDLGVGLQEPREPHLARHAGYRWCTTPGRRASARAASTARTAATSRGTDGLNQFCLPQSYESDDLTNNEIGWKTEFLNHRLQWNGAVYQENWDNVQVGFFDPGEIGNLTFDTNGQNFRVRGLETSIVARVTDGLTLQGAASWNRSEQTNSPALIDNNPLSVNYGKPITQVVQQRRRSTASR